MADVYRRSGRGGAGNFYSQKEIDETMKRKSEDLEAQKSQQVPADEPPSDPADVPAQSPQIASAISSGAGASAGVKTYARSGRGGAGNFVDPTNVVQGPASPTPTSPTAGAPKQHQPSRSAGLSGRGGAGNWTEQKGGEGAPYDAEQERKRREALDAHILQDIRDSLPQPPKIHYMHGEGRGRKPDLLPK
ncbi:hypothetical protein GGS26DRAFT_593558 [Hypomontagnella submonticulosa]|nr:hypothetical protein GGS26DRAFT_593558 [Hypomontagnella submonticulosa]